jgi:hypothetical protein
MQELLALKNIRGVSGFGLLSFVRIWQCRSFFDYLLETLDKDNGLNKFYAF